MYASLSLAESELVVFDGSAHLSSAHGSRAACADVIQT